jgi:hypothetical protein
MKMIFIKSGSPCLLLQGMCLRGCGDIELWFYL